MARPTQRYGLAVQRDAGALYVSAMTLMEIEIGILLIERRDAAQGARLRTWITHHVLPEFQDRTLAIDTAVALRYMGRTHGLNGMP